MNKKFKKFLKRTAIVTTGVVAFGGTLVGGYLLAPNRTKFIDISVKQRAKTPFEKFVERITRDIGLEEDTNTAAKYLSATFDDFNVAYTVEGSEKVNNISVTGGADVRVSALSLSGIEFNIDVEADYNGQKLPLTLGHFQDDVYFGLKDLKIKFTEFNEENLLKNYWYSFAYYANLDFHQLLEGLGDIIGDKVGGLIDGLLNGSSEEPEPSEANKSGGINVSSLLASGPKEEHKNNLWTFTLGEEGSDLCIKLITDEDFGLKRVDLGTLSAGPVTVSGAINVELKPYNQFVSPASSNEYVEVFNYSGLTQKLISLLKEDGEHQKLGLEFSLDLDNIKNSKVDIAKVNGSVNVDLDNLLDLSQYVITAKPETNGLKRGEISESSIYNTIKKVGFNLQLDLLGQNDVEYANLDLVFAEGQGYLRFNEQADKSAVMKLNIDTETMNWIVDKVPELIDSVSNKETTTIESLSKFLSDDLVNAIKDGDYSFILEMIDTLRNDENGFELGVDISSLGIGQNAYVDLLIKNDSTYPNIDAILSDDTLTDEEKEALITSVDNLENASGLELNVSNLAFGDFALNASLKSARYSEPDLGAKSDYQSVKFIKDVVEQISDFVDTKKTGFEIEGSMKRDGIGIDFTGKGQLDNNDEVKEGYGTMLINEYKYRASEVWAQHKLAVNVTNLESNVIKTTDKDGNVIRNNQNEALFVYGDPAGDNVKGKMHLQTFTDIFDLITTFIDDYGEDAKYTKFLAPITKMLGMSALGDIIESKDYVRLASIDLLKEVSVINNGGGLRIVVSKVMLGLPNDITIEIEFNGNNASENQTLKALHVRDLVLSDKEDAKTLNLTFTLTDYDNNYVDIVRKNDTYMNLDGVKTLLDLGINTTKVNFYHLSANAVVNALEVFDIELNGVNFYIYVDGERVKIYGKIDEIPTIPFVTTDVNDEVFTGSKDMSCELSFETYADNSGNKVGGMFNIRRTLKDKTSKTYFVSHWPFYETVEYYKCNSYHYRTDSSNFMDSLVDYLMGGVLGLRESIVNRVVGSSTSSSSDEKAAGNFTNTFTSTGFSCTTTGTGTNTKHTIKLGLNLNELTGIDLLRELEATITSTRLTYEGNDEGIDVLSTLDASLRIHFAVDLYITFNARMVEAQVLREDSLASWNNKGAAGLAALSGDVNGTAIGENSSYYNAPKNPYKWSFEEWPD